MKRNYFLNESNKKNNQKYSSLKKSILSPPGGQKGNSWSIQSAASFLLFLFLFGCFNHLILFLKRNQNLLSIRILILDRMKENVEEKEKERIKVTFLLDASILSTPLVSRIII